MRTLLQKKTAGEKVSGEFPLKTEIIKLREVSVSFMSNWVH